MKSKTIETDKAFITRLNSQPYVSGEGDKKFDVQGYAEVKKIINHRGIEQFIDNSSLKEKMEIGRYLRTGKFEHVEYGIIQGMDKCLKQGISIEYSLETFVGMGTRGLINCLPFIGKQIDIFALEERLNHEFRNWLSDSVGGTTFKTGKIFQRLMNKEGK